MDALTYLKNRELILQEYTFEGINTGSGFSRVTKNKELYKEISIKYPNMFPNINDLRLFIQNKDNPEYYKQVFCKRCGKLLHFTYDSPTGYNKYCSVECKNQALLEWCNTNKEQHQRDIQDNCKKLQEWIKKNPKQHQSNKEHGLKALHNWQKNNPEKVKENRIKGLKALDNYRDTEAYKVSTSIGGKKGYKSLEKWKLENKELVSQINKTNVKSLVILKQQNIQHLEDLTEDFVRQHFIQDGWFLSHEFENYFNLTNSPMLEYKKKFNIKESNKFSKTLQQDKILEYCQSYIKDIIKNDRKIIAPKELDIYIPDFNLAIEYNGMMFHSIGNSEYSMFNTTTCTQSIDKLKLCQIKGIQLLTIWENEWNTKSDIWKSVILNKLGKTRRIFARKCVIKELEHKDISEFLNKNHLQGDCISVINLGLFFNNELVSVMTFGKSRYNKDYEYELLRFCNKKFISVVGGASKLLKYFEKQHKPKSLISYANRRWSNGNLYKQLGFRYIRETKPTYYYFHTNDINTIYSRIKFQKYKLSKLLKNYNPELTEIQNMFNNNYRQIFDCGQLVFGKKYI